MAHMEFWRAVHGPVMAGPGSTGTVLLFEPMFASQIVQVERASGHDRLGLLRNASARSCHTADAAGTLPLVLLATIMPALAAAAAAAVFLLWRRRRRVAASDAILGKLGASAMEDGGGSGLSPRSLRSRSLRAPLGSLADSLASEARRAAPGAAPTRPAARTAHE